MTSVNKRRAVIVSIVAVIALFIAYFMTKGPSDFPGPGSGSAVVVVVRGDSISGIGNALTQAGVVASADAFVNAANANPKSKSIGPGKYTMLKEMSGQGAVEYMLDPKSRAESRLILPEGLRLDQSLEAASKATNIPVADFNEAVKHANQLGLPAYAKNQAEGFLYPASYDLAGDETADSTLSMVFARFAKASKQLNLESKAAALGKTPFEVMTIASLVQAEGNPTDYNKIARVIYNRINQGMPLQFDTTVAYGLDITKVSLNAAELQKDTPYNTYVHKGLPVGPINSPGAAAINAALNPAKGPWVYFVTVNLETGETKFAKKYSKFLKAKAELQAYLKNHG